jgi:hypothetical protein
MLRNLRFDGLLNSVSPGLTGIQINTAAKVVIEKCDIFGFSTSGVSAVPSSGTVAVKIQETNINNNAAGVISKPTGGATVNMSIDHSWLDGNVGGAMKIDGTGGGPSNVSVNDSSMSLNGGGGTNGQRTVGQCRHRLDAQHHNQKWRRRGPDQYQRWRHIYGHGRRIDAVEQRKRVAGVQRRVPAQLQEQPSDRTGRYGSFRPSHLSIGSRREPASAAPSLQRPIMFLRA